jgi:tetratricopeptide (TPR) repeat protein
MPKRSRRAEKNSSALLFAIELERQGLLDHAEQQLFSILKWTPKEWRALHQLGSVYLSRGECAQALKFMGQAMKINPGSAEVKSNYGFILQKMERHEEALIYFGRALATDPAYAAAFLNRGASLHHLNRPVDALTNFDRVLAIDPRNTKALYNRANILHELRRFEECLAAFAQTIECAPDYADAHWNEGLTRLLIGDFEIGWKKYEWRWKTASQRHLWRDFKQPLWLGMESLAGKTILVHAEQGLGDTIQFVRYVPRLAALGAKVVLEAPRSLHPLLRRIDGCSSVIVRGEPLPDFDLHCPIMSLPLAFETARATIPADVPYLEPGIDRVEKWRTRMPPTEGRCRVALAWAGSATNKHDQLRSIAIAKLEPLLKANEGVQWLSVQRELRAGDREWLAEHYDVHHLGEELEDFDDTAAVLSLADLVITVDTAIAHLAGALARPVWILLQYSPDFRWLLERDDSPWYPSARIFRQPQFGEWEPVIANVGAELQQRALGLTGLPDFSCTAGCRAARRICRQGAR